MRMVIFVLAVLALSATARAEEFTDRVLGVTDGDTIQIERLVYNVYAVETCRMKGYNAPELTGEEMNLGRKATLKLRELLIKPVRIRTEGHIYGYQ